MSEIKVQRKETKKYGDYFKKQEHLNVEGQSKQDVHIVIKTKLHLKRVI